jgi:DNA-binding MarR family transcriptional regulator
LEVIMESGASASASAGGSEPLNPQELSGVAADVHVAVMKLARRLRSEWTEQLTPTQLSALGLLVREGPMPISALAKREGVKAPSMTRTVTNLEQQALVQRASDVTDARVVLVSATAAGAAAVERIRQARRAWLADQLAALPPDDLRVLRDAAVILGEVAAQ